MSNFFSDSESETLVLAISEIEQKTSSEIRIHIEDTCEGSPYDRAVEVFDKLQMYKTQHRTGIIIYIATLDRKIAVIGDIGINQKLEKGYWQTILDEMTQKFQTEGIYLGVLYGVEKIGGRLIEYFPEKGIATNELTNEISYGKNI
jgi:uncharacterized membrane protein